LTNYKRVTKGLMLLMDLTGDPQEFARTADPVVQGEKLTEPWRISVSPYQNIKYLLGGNNDMVKGLFHAFAWAYQILPANDPFLAEVDEHAKRMPILRVAAREKSHPGNMFSAAGLAALSSQDPEDLNKYLQFYASPIKPIDTLNLDK